MFMFASSSSNSNSQPQQQEDDFILVENVQPRTTQEEIKLAIEMKDSHFCRSCLAQLLGSTEKGDFFALDETLQAQFIALLNVGDDFSEFAINFICDHIEQDTLMKNFLTLLEKASRPLIDMLLQTETKYAEHTKNMIDTATYGYGTSSGVNSLVGSVTTHVGKSISATGLWDITKAEHYKKNVATIINAAANANSIVVSSYLVSRSASLIEAHRWLLHTPEYRTNLSTIFEKVKSAKKTESLLKSSVDELEEKLSTLVEIAKKYSLEFTKMEEEPPEANHSPR